MTRPVRAAAARHAVVVLELVEPAGRQHRDVIGECCRDVDAARECPDVVRQHFAHRFGLRWERERSNVPVRSVCRCAMPPPITTAPRTRRSSDVPAFTTAENTVSRCSLTSVLLPPATVCTARR